MSRTDRLIDLIRILRDGDLHRAEDLAGRFGVSIRTIYRDMDRLAAGGVPVTGTRGSGYRAADHVALPPLTLTRQELDALNLGIAIVSEAADPELKSAALALADKLDAVLPAETSDDADAWKTAITPLSDPARGLSHLPALRNALRGKQKLQLRYLPPAADAFTCTVRPLQLDSWGRVWTLTTWCETENRFREFRLDLIETVTPLPELFVDEPGRRLADRRP